MEEAKLGRAISRAAAGEYGYCPTRARREMRAEFGPSRVEKLEERVEALEAALERLVLGTAACLQVVKVPQVMLDVDIEAEVHRVVGHREFRIIQRIPGDDAQQEFVLVAQFQNEVR